MKALDRTADLAVASSGVSGIVTWTGDESFAGEPLVDTTFILRDIWSYTDNHTVVTNNGPCADHRRTSRPHGPFL